MRDVLPCPYCGGEVEVVRLRDKVEGKLKTKIYRIQCMQCKAVVPFGTKFPDESEEDGEKRIKQYEKHIDRVWSPLHSTKIKQSMEAEARDAQMAMASQTSMDDEINEIHDVSHVVARKKQKCRGVE